MDKVDFDLYLVTEGGLTDTSETGEFLKNIEAALKGGVKAIQIREKGLGGKRLLEVALEIRELTSRYKAKLFINDRVDVALLSGANGVHLPSSGIKVKDVRGSLGSRGEELGTRGEELGSREEELLIGVSTHSLVEAQEAEREGADFITFGPIFPTPGKARYGEPVGIGKLVEASRSIETPIFAIGGIDKDKLGEVRAAGTHGAAIISAILGAPDIEESAREIIKELRK